MAHPQHNFTSNFNGSDGHNAELTLNINGVEKKYTPAGNDQTYNVPGVARIDINLDGADLVQAIQTALDGAAQPVLVEMSIYDEEYVYQYIGDIDGQWYFGTCTTNKIVTVTVAKEDGAVNGEQIPVANGVVIVESDGLNVYSRLRTALALGQLPVLSYVGANPVYAQYEKTAGNGDLIFVGALASASDTYDQYNIYTVASNNTVTVTTREANVVFVERFHVEYSEITELLQDDRVIMTTDGFIYCGYGDDKYYFIRFKITGSYGAMFEMSSVDTNNHWASGSSGKLLDSDFWRLAFANGDTLNIALNSYNQPYLTQCPLYQTTTDASSVTEGTFVTIVPNNKLTFITNLLVPNLEIRAYLECYDVPSEHVANFAVEVTPTVDCTVTVKTSKNSYATPHWITLSRASGVSNVMRAGKKYQITCIGTCWTIAEFELPS